MIALLVSLLAIGPQATPDQRTPAPEGTVISAVAVSGFDIDRFSPGLRQDIRALVGTPLKQERLDALAARIEEERPRRVAAVRTVLDAGGQARVSFIVGERGETREADNVNARYVVERVGTEGFPDDAIPQALRDDLQALVGHVLDSDAADRLLDRLEEKVPRYQVTRRIERGSEQGKIQIVFEARRKEPPLWLRYQPLRTNAVFHSDQGWGTYLDLGIGSREIRFTPILALDDADDLVEEYGGGGVRFETRKLGTQRLGASLEWSWFDSGWRDQTVAAIAERPVAAGDLRHAADSDAVDQVRLHAGTERVGRCRHHRAGADRAAEGVDSGKFRDRRRRLSPAVVQRRQGVATDRRAGAVARRNARAAERSRLRPLPGAGRVLLRPAASSRDSHRYGRSHQR